MLDRFYRLKTSIKEANAKTANPVDLDSLLQDEAAGSWKKKYEEVKSELDEQKRRRGEERKSASPTATTAGRSGLRYLLPEVDQEVVLSLRTQISELQDKVALLRTQLLEKESLNGRLVEKEKEMQSTIK